MSLHEFVQLIKGHAGSEDSALRKSIAKSVLVHKDTVRPSEIAFKEIGGLAKAHDLPEVAEYFKNPSLEMISKVGNAVFYNKHPVTIAPARKNNGGKSPKLIADEVLMMIAIGPVSYTHLTLPTIYSV